MQDDDCKPKQAVGYNKNIDLIRYQSSVLIKIFDTHYILW